VSYRKVSPSNEGAASTSMAISRSFFTISFKIGIKNSIGFLAFQ
jgi:hypothetical protein